MLLVLLVGQSISCSAGVPAEKAVSQNLTPPQKTPSEKALGEKAPLGKSSVPVGIMSFGWTKNFPRSASLNFPYVDGMSAYMGWSDIEKQDGVYDFSLIDDLVTVAREKGKTINLMFSPGAHAPEWLYKKGARSFSWKRQLMEDQALLRGDFSSDTAPLPWDPIFLEHWKRFIGKVADKYRNDATIGYISLTGPAIRSITTAILLKKKEDWDRFYASGYSYDKVLSAWKEVIDHYEKVLPDKRLMLAIAPSKPGSQDVTLSRTLVDYIRSKRYHNISFFCVFLNDTWFLRSKAAKDIRSLLKEAKADGFTFGYQMAQSAHRNATWKKSTPIVKSLRESLAGGIGDGASWIEVWHADIVDPQAPKTGAPNAKYVEDLKWAHDALHDRAKRP